MIFSFINQLETYIDPFCPPLPGVFGCNLAARNPRMHMTNKMH